MKHLILLRHAKALPGDPGTADRDRGLAPRGFSDAALIGAAIAFEPPDAALCSPARRTRETLDAIVARLPKKPTVEFIDALYAPPDDYVDTIAASGSGAGRLMVVGHNPAIQATALSLTGSGERKLRNRIAAKFPTCGVAAIAFDVDDWADVGPGKGRLVMVLRPRDLGPGDGDD